MNTGEMSKMFKCPIPKCKATFSRRDGLKRHLVGPEGLSESDAIKLMPPKKVPERKTKKETKEQTIKNCQQVADMVLEELPTRERLKVAIKKRGTLKPETWLLEFSDLHYGQIVKPIEVGGLAEYNTAVAKERLEYLVKVLVRILEYYPNPPKELVIAFLGDMIDNSVMRGNQQASIEFGAITQTMLVSELITDFIVSLSKYFPKIRCYGVYGNHGRLMRSPTDAHPSESFDKMAYYIVKNRIKGMKNITLEYTEAQHMIFRANGWKFWMEHGDTVRGWMGIPFYGGQREKARISDILGKFKEQADYVLLGHHHEEATLTGQGIFFNGSFVGGDLYSIGRLRRMSIPTQSLIGINDAHGVVWTRSIQLIDKPREMKIKIYGN